MLENEVKVGMMVRVPDHNKHSKNKKILSHKTRDDEIIYETEQEVTGRFKRPYKCISQITAKDIIEYIEEN